MNTPETSTHPVRTDERGVARDLIKALHATGGTPLNPGPVQELRKLVQAPPRVVAPPSHAVFTPLSEGEIYALEAQAEHEGRRAFVEAVKACPRVRIGPGASL